MNIRTDIQNNAGTGTLYIGDTQVKQAIVLLIYFRMPSWKRSMLYEQMKEEKILDGHAQKVMPLMASRPTHRGFLEYNSQLILFRSTFIYPYCQDAIKNNTQGVLQK